MDLKAEFQIVTAELNNEIKELEYILKFKKEKAKLQRLAKAERALALIYELSSRITE